MIIKIKQKTLEGLTWMFSFCWVIHSGCEGRVQCLALYQGCLRTAGLCPQQTSPREHRERSWSWNLTQTTKKTKNSTLRNVFLIHKEHRSTAVSGLDPCNLNNNESCPKMWPYNTWWRNCDNIIAKQKQNKKSSFPHDLRGLTAIEGNKRCGQWQRENV